MESQSLSGAGVITVCLNIPTPNIWAQASRRRWGVAGPEVQDLLGVELFDFPTVPLSVGASKPHPTPRLTFRSLCIL